MKRVTLFGAMLCVGASVCAREVQSNWLEDVVYRDVDQTEDSPSLDRAMVDLVFGREPLSPISTSRLLNDGTKEWVFFFPMVDAVNNINSRVIKRINDQGGKVCDLRIEPIEAPEFGLKVTFSFRPEQLSLVCHIGLQGDRRCVRFRLHDKAYLNKLEQFNALRMASFFGGFEGGLLGGEWGVAII